MADRKAVIKNADMSEEMQQDAIDVSTQAMEKYNIEKDIAAFIKKEFDKKYVNLLLLCYMLTVGTIRRGTVLLVVTLVPTWLMNQSILSTSTSAKLQFSCSSLVRVFEQNKRGQSLSKHNSQIFPSNVCNM